MKINKIYTVTDTYRTSKGNEYTIVAVELTDISEEQEFMYKPTMYGTISHKDIDENGKLKKIYTLAKMSISESIAGAIRYREMMEETKEMNEQELIEYFKARASK